MEQEIKRFMENHQMIGNSDACNYHMALGFYYAYSADAYRLAEMLENGELFDEVEISIVIMNLYVAENTITKYSITEKQLVGHVTEKVENYDLMSAIMICLGKPNSENYNGVLKLLNVLLSSEKAPDEKEKILHDDFDIEMTQNLEREVSLMCNLSQGIVESTTERNTLDSIRNLMETLNLTIEEAMAALKIPESERPKYVSMLEDQ